MGRRGARCWKAVCLRSALRQGSACLAPLQRREAAVVRTTHTDTTNVSRSDHFSNNSKSFFNILVVIVFPFFFFYSANCPLSLSQSLTVLHNLSKIILITHKVSAALRHAFRMQKTKYSRREEPIAAPSSQLTCPTAALKCNVWGLFLSGEG